MISPYVLERGSGRPEWGLDDIFLRTWLSSGQTRRRKQRGGGGWMS